MRKLMMVLALVALAAGVVVAQTSAPLDQNPGFMGVRLGSAVSKFKDMVEADRTDLEVLYRRKAQKLEHPSGARLSGVTYHAFQGLIYQIEFEPATDADSLKLLAALQTSYGKGEVRNMGKLMTVYWEGRRTRLTYNHIPGSCPDACGGAFVDSVLDEAKMQAFVKGLKKKP